MTVSPVPYCLVIFIQIRYYNNESVPRRKYHTKEIEPWKGFADSLKSEEDKKLFLKMLEGCQKYALAINAKGRPFLAEHLIMALLLEEHKMISWLQKKSPSQIN